MAFTAQQFAEFARTYEQAAADFLVPAQQRAVFARKADLYRLLAKLADKKAASVSADSPSGKAATPEAGGHHPKVRNES